MAERQAMIVVTGMSGAGRSTAANTLEDLDWYVVDNIPPQMLAPLLDLAGRAGPSLPRVAAVVDVRGRNFFSELSNTLSLLRADTDLKILFLDASDATLVRRFESVRRPHPMQRDGTILDGIARERSQLANLRESADIVIDTSDLNAHALGAKVRATFASESESRVQLAIESFGFKYGVPTDADIVIDMRFLPNPFWVPELSARSGLDPEVSEYVLSRRGAAEFLDLTTKALGVALAGYRTENKAHVTLAVGCTGGRHRSVAFAEALKVSLGSSDDVRVTVTHRDIDHE